MVSYHLRKLREQNIVQENKSDADGREFYYSLNLDLVRNLYLASGNELHPGLGATESVEEDDARVGRPVRVLFLCTQNSARSQMAEGILRSVGQGRVEVFSAGAEPGEVHPMAISAMQEIKVDISRHISKHLNQFQGQSFDYVITVCDRVRESCPIFPGDPIQIHWSIPDPASVDGPEEIRYEAFRETRLQLLTRIRYLWLIIQHNLKTLKA